MLPATWSHIKLRWAASIYAGGTPSKTNVAFWENGTVPWLNSGAVNQGTICEVSAFITEAALVSSSAKWIKKGSLVVALAGQGKTKGMVAQLGIDATCNQSMAAIVPSDKLQPRYLLWWLSSNYQNIRNMAGGDLRDGLNLELLGDIECPLPTQVEQTQIAKFLDYETAKIDALIEKQQQLIALLKEKRESLLHLAIHAEGTEMVRLENCWEQVNRPICRVDKETYYPIGLLNRGRGIFHKDPTLGGELGDSDFFYVENGDLILSGQFAWEGAVALASEEESGCVATHRYPIVKGRPGVTETAFLWAFFASQTGDFLLNESSRGAAGRNRPLNMNSLMKAKIPVPPMDSQRAVADLVIREKALREHIRKPIALLQERRTALISAAVTGKIDVRDWKPPKSKPEAEAA